MLYIKEFVIMVLLALVIAGNVTDIMYDYREGASLAHLFVELALVLVSFVLILILSIDVWRQSRSNRSSSCKASSRSGISHRPKRK